MNIKKKTNHNTPILAVIVPCYNEEEVVEKTMECLQNKLIKMMKDKIIDLQSFCVFVDDGSKDKTLEILSSKKTKVNKKIIKLSRNFGHQGALLAGYHYVINRCDCAISIDCDLQDDIGVFDKFVNKFVEGYDVVLGVRKTREKDTLFKRWTANIFYTIMQYMYNKEDGGGIIKNHADYRLLSHRALKELDNYRESNLFIRGIIPALGFDQSIVYYDRGERYAGVSKYPLGKMVSFAWNGITSFSIFPLKMVTGISFICLFFAFLLSFYAFYIVIFTEKAVPGWASITIPISFFGGIQIFTLGIIGEYIGKIYKEVKNRPKYIIEEIL